MFSKPDKAPHASRAESHEPPPRKALAPSLIAENVTLQGDLSSDGDIQLDGAVRGDLCVGHLSIGETGQVTGAIQAATVEVRGRVTGAIVAKSVRLYGSARVEGDITHDQIAIEAGAYFSGRSLKPAVPEALSIVHATAAE